MTDIYTYSPENGEFTGKELAYEDKHGDLIVAAYSTMTEPPLSGLSENQYCAYFDDDGSVPRVGNSGKWVIKNKLVKITAYKKTDLSEKVFDDAPLMTDDYTEKKPASPFDEWSGGQWVLNEQKKYESDYEQVRISRLNYYRNHVDPLMNEAQMMRLMGDGAGADKKQSEALKEYEKIKSDFPFPEKPTK